jgi:hypothetical protein
LAVLVLTGAGGAEDVAKVGWLNEKTSAAVKSREFFQGGFMDDFWAIGEEIYEINALNLKLNEKKSQIMKNYDKNLYKRVATLFLQRSRFINTANMVIF